MAYIRIYRRKGRRPYYALVESIREGKKVRQKVLKYLGTSPPEGWEPKKRRGK